MPRYFLEHVESGIVIASIDIVCSGGPAPGQMDFLYEASFENVSFTSPPNVVASTGNPHWTVHPIWVNLSGAGFVINRKTPSPGNQIFTVYFYFMGPGTLNGKSPANISFREHDRETFDKLVLENCQS